MNSSRRIFVNKLVTSKYTKNLSYVLSCFISSLKVKLILVAKINFIAINSKVVQNKMKKIRKIFCKKTGLPARICVRHLCTMIFIRVFSIQKLFINLFLLALMIQPFIKHLRLTVVFM